jgi:hypothetical protein
MRTLFEDTDERANLEDARERDNPRLPLYLWVMAVLFFASSWGFYYWASHRKPPEKPLAAASLEDVSQVNQAINQFNGFVSAGKWDEAQGMLSAEALQRLQQENKLLRESLLGDRKETQVAQTVITPSRSRTPSTLRVDCAYVFADNQNTIIPLTLVLENDRLLVNSW